MKMTRLLLLSTLIIAMTIPAFAATYNAQPTDDIWVTFMAGNPAGDEYLRTWHNTAEPYIDPNYPGNPANFFSAFSYMKWDMSGIPAGYYQINSATLTVVNIPAGWTLSHGQSNPLEMRSIAPAFSEISWNYWNTTNPAPGGVYGEGDLSNYSSTTPFTITTDLLAGSTLGRVEADFISAFNEAITTTGELGIAASSTMPLAGMGGPDPYKFQSRDHASGTGPVLSIDYSLVPCSVAEIKTLDMAMGTLVLAENKVVTAVFGGGPDMIYISEPDGSSAIGVNVNGAATGLVAGDVVTVTGTTAMWDASELGIEAQSIVVAGNQTPLTPVCMKNRDLGGTALGNQPDVPGSHGANNIGRLVRVTGAVSASNPLMSLPFTSVQQVFWINDGSDISDGLLDGSGSPATGVAVVNMTGVPFPPSGQLGVTGIIKAINGPNGSARIIAPVEVTTY